MLVHSLKFKPYNSMILMAISFGSCMCLCGAAYQCLEKKSFSTHNIDSQSHRACGINCIRDQNEIKLQGWA